MVGEHFLCKSNWKDFDTKDFDSKDFETKDFGFGSDFQLPEAEASFPADGKDVSAVSAVSMSDPFRTLGFDFDGPLVPVSLFGIGSHQEISGGVLKSLILWPGTFEMNCI